MSQPLFLTSSGPSGCLKATLTNTQKFSHSSSSEPKIKFSLIFPSFGLIPWYSSQRIMRNNCKPKDIHSSTVHLAFFSNLFLPPPVSHVNIWNHCVFVVCLMKTIKAYLFVFFYFIRTSKPNRQWESELKLYECNVQVLLVRGSSINDVIAIGRGSLRFDVCTKYILIIIVVTRAG